MGKPPAVFPSCQSTDNRRYTTGMNFRRCYSTMQFIRCVRLRLKIECRSLINTGFAPARPSLWTFIEFNVVHQIRIHAVGLLRP